MSCLCALDDQNTGASASASDLPVKFRVDLPSLMLNKYLLNQSVNEFSKSQFQERKGVCTDQEKNFLLFIESRNF